MRGEYPKYVAVKIVPDIFGFYTNVKFFKSLDDACRYAFLKGGKVFGLSPEYEFEVHATAKALCAAQTEKEE